MRKAGILLLLTVVGLLLAPSCAKKREVSIELLDPCTQQNVSFRAAAKYVEFAVFPNACPDDKILMAGDTTGARFRATVPATENLPDVGDLPKSKFGFAVILRDSKCSVIGFGCTEADLESISGVRVAACDWSIKNEKGEPTCACKPLTTGGGCVPPLTCVDGACKSGGEGDGGICSLSVAASGPLPDPVAAGASLSGPGVVATDSGFVIGYRDQSGATLRAVVTYLSDGGTRTDPSVFDLGGCTTKEPKDGVGLAFSGGNGLMATSLPDCGKGAGAVFIPFDGSGNVSQASGPRNAAFHDLTVAQGPSIAPASTANEYEFLYRVLTDSPQVIERVVLQGPAFKPTPIVHPFGEDDTVQFGIVATTKDVRAFMAPVQADNATKVLVSSNSSDTIDSKGEFALPLATWAAITAWDKRVAAAVPASVGMTLSVGELDATGVPVKLAPALVGSGTVLSGALAALRSHLIVAQGQNGKITVLRLEDAKGVIKTTPAGTIDLSGAIGTVNLSAFDGQHLAMAAQRDRIALVWLNKSKLSASDPVGGWALLRCSQ